MDLIYIIFWKYLEEIIINLWQKSRNTTCDYTYFCLVLFHLSFLLLALSYTQLFLAKFLFNRDKIIYSSDAVVAPPHRSLQNYRTAGSLNNKIVHGV